jgi:predicted RNA-binding protein with PIN domain
VNPSLYIVDGYNLLHHLFPGVGRDELFARRDWLVDRLASYAALRGAALSIVFDGHEADSTSTHPIRGIDVEVVFAGGRFTADTLIARRIASQRADVHVVVVSGDREVQRAAARAGVSRMTPRELAGELNTGASAKGLDSDPSSGRMPSRLEDKVDPETLQKLRRLRDGS